MSQDLTQVLSTLGAEVAELRKLRAESRTLREEFAHDRRERQVVIDWYVTESWSRLQHDRPAADQSRIAGTGADTSGPPAPRSAKTRRRIRATR